MQTFIYEDLTYGVVERYKNSTAVVILKKDGTPDKRYSSYYLPNEIVDDALGTPKPMIEAVGEHWQAIDSREDQSEILCSMLRQLPSKADFSDEEIKALPIYSWVNERIELNPISAEANSTLALVQFGTLGCPPQFVTVGDIATYLKDGNERALGVSVENTFRINGHGMGADLTFTTCSYKGVSYVAFAFNERLINGGLVTTSMFVFKIKSMNYCHYFIPFE